MKWAIFWSSISRRCTSSIVAALKRIIGITSLQIYPNCSVEGGCWEVCVGSLFGSTGWRRRRIMVEARMIVAVRAPTSDMLEQMMMPTMRLWLLNMTMGREGRNGVREGSSP